MTVLELQKNCGLRVLAGTCSNMETGISGCYAGDLLSWAMSRLGKNEAWITVMGNVNAIGVAALTGCACIILCDNAPLDEDARASALKHGVTVLQSGERAYRLALRIGACLSDRG